MKGFWTRPRGEFDSTDFSNSRFLTPFLSGYEGFSLFIDSDMLILGDIAEMANYCSVAAQYNQAVRVVKHKYEPKEETKFLGAIQTKYSMKNWSSVMLWNCGHEANKAVTPEFVNAASPMDLHRFTWLADEQIGELDVRWNWLVGEYAEPPADVKNVHWTVGGPYFLEYQDVDFSAEWFKEAARMGFCAQRL